MHQTHNLRIRRLQPQLHELRYPCPHDDCFRRFVSLHAVTQHQRLAHSSMIGAAVDDMHPLLSDHASEAKESKDELSFQPRNPLLSDHASDSSNQTENEFPFEPDNPWAS